MFRHEKKNDAIHDQSTVTEHVWEPDFGTKTEKQKGEKKYSKRETIL